MRLNPWGYAAAAALAALAAAVLPLGGSGEVEARVVGVADGDTVTVLLPDRTQEKVRLVEIDAPETDQPYGQASKQQLSRLVHGRTVTLRRTGEDRYGRTLARVYQDGRDVNAAMVESGAAWVYDAYSTDPALEALEVQARAEAAGLWSLQPDQTVPPWDWRRGAREPAPALVRVSEQERPRRDPAAPRRSEPAQLCGAKRTCGEMADCAEARRHLTECGLARLDRDGDGVPCESLCGG